MTAASQPKKQSRGTPPHLDPFFWPAVIVLLTALSAIYLPSLGRGFIKDDFVWIGTSREHYGLHGTPAPSRVGHSQTHGCVTMTNWDALRLAGLVQPGTAVVFE